MKNRILPIGMVSIYLAVIMPLSYSIAQPPPPRPPAMEERLHHVSEKIDKEISLTPKQKEKLTMAYKDFFISVDKMREQNKDSKTPPPPPPPPPGSKAEMDKLAKLRDEKIRLVLDAAQYKKYQSIEKTLHPPPPGEGRPEGPGGPKKN